MGKNGYKKNGENLIPIIKRQASRDSYKKGKTEMIPIRCILGFHNWIKQPNHDDAYVRCTRCGKGIFIEPWRT